MHNKCGLLSKTACLLVTYIWETSSISCKFYLLLIWNLMPICFKLMIQTQTSDNIHQRRTVKNNVDEDTLCKWFFKYCTCMQSCADADCGSVSFSSCQSRQPHFFYSLSVCIRSNIKQRHGPLVLCILLHNELRRRLALHLQAHDKHSSSPTGYHKHIIL